MKKRVRIKSLLRHVREVYSVSTGFVRTPVAMATASLLAMPGLLIFSSGQQRDAVRQSPPVVQQLVPQVVQPKTDFFGPRKDLIIRLESEDRFERKSAARLIAQTYSGAVGKLATALLEELDRNAPSTEDLIAQLSSQDPSTVEQAELGLKEKGVEAIEKLMIALKQKSKNGSSTISMGSKSEIPVSRLSSKSKDQSEGSIAKLVDELQECSLELNCAAAKQLLSHGKQARNQLIQATLSHNDKVKILQGNCS